MDFVFSQTSFLISFYGGLCCCLLSAALTLITHFWKGRGTRQQYFTFLLAYAIFLLLLLPTLFWSTIRRQPPTKVPSDSETGAILLYILFCGWLLPAVSCLRFLLSSRYSVQESVPSTRQHNPGVRPEKSNGYVYSAEVPWGWLEYTQGNFQGQRLALTQRRISIGRDEQCEIWLDDDLASRYHAELSWGEVEITVNDCGSLNGCWLNGNRVSRFAIIHTGDVLEIGSHSFRYQQADLKQTQEEDDPLNNHTWRKADDVLGSSTRHPSVPHFSDFAEEHNLISLETSAQRPLQETPAAQPVITTSPLAAEFQSYLIIREGLQRGQQFALNQPEMIAGRGVGSTIIIDDASLSIQHARFSQQRDGVYVQDLMSRNGTKVNDLLLRRPRRLQDGDIIILGNISLEYGLVVQKQDTPPALQITPSSARLQESFIQPLRLPSKKKEPPTTQNEHA